VLSPKTATARVVVPGCHRPAWLLSPNIPTAHRAPLSLIVVIPSV